MKKLFIYLFGFSCFAGVQAQEAFEKDFTRPEATEIWEPKPAIVTPGLGNAPPSDAIVLFDGKSLDSWVMAKDEKACQWKLNKNMMTSKTGSGNIKTKQKFGDCQLHIEFMLPPDVKNTPEPNN